MRILFALFICTFLVLVSFNPALAGKNKTVTALKSAVEQIEKSGISSDASKDSIAEANKIIKYSWRMARHEVYRDAGEVFDEFIKLTKGTDVKIRKPDWL